MLQNFSIYRPSWILAIITFIISFTVVEISINNQTLIHRIEKIYSDTWHQIAGKRYEPKHTLIINIDDKSLQAMEDTPLVFWTPFFAEVIRSLKEHQAKIIGLDFLFSSTAEQWLRNSGLELKAEDYNYDQRLRKEIADGKVILVSTTAESVQVDQDNNPYTEQILPALDMLFSIPNLDFIKYISYSNLNPDSDGVIRSYADAPIFNFRPEVRDSNPPVFSFASLLALHFYNYSEGMVKQVYKTGGTNQPIVFVGPPKTIPSIRFIDYLNAIRDPQTYHQTLNDYRDLIKGKVVIIGSDYVGLNDNHITPYGTQLFDGFTNYMSGPEIQANITEAILTNKNYEFLDPITRWLIQASFLIIAAFAFRYLSTTWGTLVLFLLIIFTIFLGYFLFIDFIMFPIASLQTGLAISFVFVNLLSFSGETRKRQHVERLFGRYVSRTIVEQYIESGEMPSLGGESSNVSVIFSDIRNFTSLSEIIKPQELVEVINEYFQIATPCIINEDGHLDKFIGDAIMAEFGMPAKHPDHALRACKAAVNLIKVAEKFKVRFKEKLPWVKDFEFNIGVGINSGNAIMGNIGSATKTDYTALGDTVNVASRLESATKTTGWKIVASDSTISQTKEQVIIGRKDQINVKGRAEPIIIYELLGIKDN